MNESDIIEVAKGVLIGAVAADPYSREKHETRGAWEAEHVYNAFRLADQFATQVDLRAELQRRRNYGGAMPGTFDTAPPFRPDTPC